MVGILSFNSLSLQVFGFKGLPKDQENTYNLGIRDYDVVNSNCGTIGGGGEVSGSGYERLKAAVKAYGEVAMEMQREYGTPWEMVLAQMQMESQVGTDGIAVKGATNNWLGLIGTGDAGYWISSKGRKWAKFTSVEASIKDWAGPRVLRNAKYHFYDAAFAHLDPNNYNLDAFVHDVIYIYAPPHENDTPRYISSVLSFIKGPIAEARAEMGWLSSGELAKQENIPIGGRHPIGTDTGSSTTETSTNCALGGNVNSVAIQLSYDHRGEAKNNPIEAYDTAMGEVGTRVACTGPKMGDSCDVYVATVYRKSVDPDFPCCYTNNMRTRLRANDKYELVVDGYQTTASTADLQPGDIMILNGHIMMYVALQDGSFKIASASYCGRTSDHAGNIYFSDSRGSYDVLRWKGGSV
jgi:Mannosyl-glycoprotein endo-beta-N-acetylglucosaminidase.